MQQQLMLPDTLYPDARPFSSGTHGTIFLATGEDGEKLVLKRLAKNGAGKQRIRNEIEAGIRLRGIQQVPFFHRHIETEEHTWLIFDFVDGVDLLTWMEDFNFEPVEEHTVRQIALQIIHTLDHVHSRGISHKDIKLENLILDTNTGLISLLDFGLCYSFSKGKDHLCKDFAGSREYSPPELLLTYGPFSATKADVWSLGVTLYALLFGCFPFGFDTKTAEEMISSGRHPSPTFPEDVPVSPDAVDLLAKMIEVDPEKRLDLRQIVLHPWFDELCGPEEPSASP